MTDKELTKHMVYLTQSVKFLLEEAKKSYEDRPFKTKLDCARIKGITKLGKRMDNFMDAEAVERTAREYKDAIISWGNYMDFIKAQRNIYNSMIPNLTAMSLAANPAGIKKDLACSKEKQEEMLVRTFHHREGYYHKWSFAIYEKDRYIPEGDYMMMGNQIVHSRETFNSQVEAEKAGEEVIRKIRATKSP